MSALLQSLVSMAGQHQTGQDTRMRFSVSPAPGDSGFWQWHSAMTMCARLPEGIPPEFRKRLWLTLAEHQLRTRKIDWAEVERRCFNQRANPDDDELGDQIVKDLHRTGCSLFSGEDAAANQAMLKRVLLAYSRWNKTVGYCQGFNMLAAIILEEVDRREADALKVMIYLIEGVLPESYFANNLRGLSVDMAVFRDLLRMRLPTLSKHLDYLRQDSADQNTGTCYEPPLTNVFTMQWFLTLFSNCLPKETVMRVWDLTFLQGNEVLLRTALAIWDKLAPRILAVDSADEFYTVMGGLTHDMLRCPSLIPPNTLVQSIVGMAPFPLPGLGELRDRYAYNITPWTLPVPPSVSSSVSSAARRGLRLLYEEDESEEDETSEKMAVAAAFGLSAIFRKSSGDSSSSSKAGLTIGGGGGNQKSTGSDHPTPSSRPNLDISTLKKQYSRLRERQRQAHIILTSRTHNFNLPHHQPNLTEEKRRRGSVDLSNRADPKNSSTGGGSSTPPLSMNHLLRGKTALTAKTKRVVARGLVVVPPAPKRKVERKNQVGDISPHHPQLSSAPYQVPAQSPCETTVQTQQQSVQQHPKVGAPIRPTPRYAIPQQLTSSPTRHFSSPDASSTDAAPKTTNIHNNSTVSDLSQHKPQSGMKVSETLHWKDALKHRRASLPSGVKLLEGGKSGSLPDTVGEEESGDEDSSSGSTSTELCDEEAFEHSDIPEIREDGIGASGETKSSCDSSQDVLSSSSSDICECPSNTIEQNSPMHNIIPEVENVTTDVRVLPVIFPQVSSIIDNPQNNQSEQKYELFGTDKEILSDSLINHLQQTESSGDKITISNDNEIEKKADNNNVDVKVLAMNRWNEGNRNEDFLFNQQIDAEKTKYLDEQTKANDNNRDQANVLNYSEENVLGDDSVVSEIVLKLDKTKDSELSISVKDISNNTREEINNIVHFSSEKEDKVSEEPQVCDSTIKPLNLVTNTECSNATLELQNSLESERNINIPETQEVDASFSVKDIPDTEPIDIKSQEETPEVKPSISGQLRQTQSLYSVTSPESELTGKVQYSTDGEVAELCYSSPQSPIVKNCSGNSDLPAASSNSSEQFTSFRGISFENFKFTQTPTTLSRSSSISKRSRSSSSISPRSPRMTFYDDESSFELCREAESIRQYIDSEFLSNLLLKGEKEKAAKKSEKKKNRSPKLRHKKKERRRENSSSKDSNEEVGNGEPIRRARSPLLRQPSIEQLDSFSVEPKGFEGLETTSRISNKYFQTSIQPSDSEIPDSRTDKCNDSLLTSKTKSLNFGNMTTEIHVELDQSTHDDKKISISQSDSNSPESSKAISIECKDYVPVSNIFSLSLTSTDQLTISSDLPSPSPSPTFSRSSFALNSQFLRSLSASTQELLNSLALSSSFDAEKSPSPTFFPNDESVIKSEDMELALPTLAPTTSLAIHKLFSAAGSLDLDQTKQDKQVEKDTASADHAKIKQLNTESVKISPTLEILPSDSQLKIESEAQTPPVPISLKNEEASDGEIAVQSKSDKVDKISIEMVDEDILQQERALDEILAPSATVPGTSFRYVSTGHPSPYIANKNPCREIPTLQELASASLPSAKPISSAILSIPCYDKDVKYEERTHLKRRYNSPETRKSPSPRLSLRDKFERDLQSKPRHKHSKSLSKNARFQKGPNSRVNSQENKEKCTSKLDKSKSETRIGETIDNKVEELSKDERVRSEGSLERVRSEGSLERKRQTTVKFAPLNIEIPHYREPELEPEETMIEDDRTSDNEDFMSPSDEITAEIIRKRLWAGLRSFSVDADILQAYGILSSSENNTQDNLLSALSEVPSTENEGDLQKPIAGHVRKTSMTAEDLEFLETKRHNRRRGSVAALQELVKENTQLINQIVKQTINETDTKKQCLQNSNLITKSNTDNSLTSSQQLTYSAANKLKLESVSTSGTSSNGKIDSSLSFSTIGSTDTEKTDCNTLKGGNSVKQEGIMYSTMVNMKANNETETETTLMKPAIVTDPEESSYQFKDMLVTQKEFIEADSGCFKLPLSAFCVNASKRNNTEVVERHSVVALDHKTVTTKPKNDQTISPISLQQQTELYLDEKDMAQVSIVTKSVDSAECLPNQKQSQADKSKNSSPSLNSMQVLKSFESSEKEDDLQAGVAAKTPSHNIYDNESLLRPQSLHGNDLQSEKNHKTAFQPYRSEDKPSSSKTPSPNPKGISPKDPHPLISSSSTSSDGPKQSSRPDRNHFASLGHASRPITFNPFPTRSAGIHRKEVPIKLGLYTPSTK